MTNFKLNFAAIIFAIFALTSCQKDGMNELQTTATTAVSTAANTDRNLPTEGINMVFDNVRTQASAAKFEQSAQSRNKGYKKIGCGFDYDGCTKGQGNSLDLRHYPDNIDALGAPFDGEDEYFFFEVASTPEAIMTYDIVLSNMTVDLDLFVFALNSNYQITATKGMSINGGASDEKLTLTDLNPGLYIVAVDAYISSIKGHYNLTMECSAVSANPPSVSLIGINMAEVGFDNQKTGAYRQLSATDWKEIGVDGAEFNFVEVARDEWSVYLRDDARGVNIQLDIHRMKVVYSDDAGNAFDLYDIYKSDDKMNGFLATAITFQTGDGIIGNYTNYDLEGKAWRETAENPDSNTFEFTEVVRYEWSVYLRDDARGVNILLDLYRSMVVYSDDAGNTFDLYEITEVK